METENLQNSIMSISTKDSCEIKDNQEFKDCLEIIRQQHLELNYEKDFIVE